jgi:hypothetical protein
MQHFCGRLEFLSEPFASRLAYLFAAVAHCYTTSHGECTTRKIKRSLSSEVRVKLLTPLPYLPEVSFTQVSSSLCNILLFSGGVKEIGLFKYPLLNFHTGLNFVPTVSFY